MGKGRIGFSLSGLVLAHNQNRQAKEPVWQPRFPELVFSAEARKLLRFNKNENAKGMWKSIFDRSHTGSAAYPTSETSALQIHRR